VVWVVVDGGQGWRRRSGERLSSGGGNVVNWRRSGE
jgi:hypothetical protein